MSARVFLRTVDRLVIIMSFMKNVVSLICHVCAMKCHYELRSKRFSRIDENQKKTANNVDLKENNGPYSVQVFSNGPKLSSAR